MPTWVFDKARFVEDVLKPASQGWPPSENRFRVYLLRDTETDPSVIRTALDTVLKELAGLTRPWPTEVSQLRAAHSEAVAILTDPRRRSDHAAVVRAQQKQLANSLTDRLAGAPGLPKAVIVALAAATGGRHTANDVRRCLAELEAAEQEPAALPPPAEPPRWQQLRKELATAGAGSIWEYLARPGLQGPGTTVQQLDDQRDELMKRTGAAVTAERSLVADLRQIVAAGRLDETLRFEALDDLGRHTEYRFTQVLERARTLRPRLRALGIGLDEQALAYAVWCARRYGDGAVGSWKAQYQAAEARKDLRAAVELLGRADRLTADETKHLERLRARVKELDGQIAEARALEATDADAAAGIYLKVRAELADDQMEAGLARCAPPSPAGVEASVDGRRVVLGWTPVAVRAGAITYHVCRSEDRPPRSPDDGARLVNAGKEPRFVDADAPGARTLHYAVFAVRADVAVSRAAVAPPVVILREVEALRLVPTADSINARWRLPEGASGVEVLRTELPAGRPVPVRDAGSIGFTDTSVRPGPTYAYLVRARWRLPDGTVRTTQGRVIEGRCQQAPQPADGLDVRLDGEELVVTWQPPRAGSVEIREGADDAPATGTLLPAADLGRVGPPLAGVSLQSTSMLRARGGDLRRGKLVAVTVLGDLAVVGPHRVVDRRLQAVTNLRALRNGGRVRLTWTWPKGSSEALVLVTRGGASTGPDDPQASRHTTSRARYDAVGMELPLQEGQYVFSVCTTATVGEEHLHGPLATVTESVSRMATYRVRRAGLVPSRRRTLVVAGAAPPMVLLAKPRTRPMDRSDGHELLRHEGGDGGVSVPFEVPGDMGRPLHLRLFSLDEAVVLRPEHPDELVIR